MSKYKGLKMLEYLHYQEMFLTDELCLHYAPCLKITIIGATSSDQHTQFRGLWSK